MEFLKQLYRSPQDDVDWFELRAIMLFPDDADKQGRARIYFHTQATPDKPLPVELNPYLASLCDSKTSLVQDIKNAQSSGLVAGQHLLYLEKTYATTGHRASSERVYDIMVDSGWSNKRSIETAWQRHYSVSHLWAAMIVLLHQHPNSHDTIPTFFKLAQAYLPYLQQHLKETKTSRLKDHPHRNSKSVGEIYWLSSALAVRLTSRPPSVSTMLKIDPLLQQLARYEKSTQVK